MHTIGGNTTVLLPVNIGSVTGSTTSQENTENRQNIVPNKELMAPSSDVGMGTKVASSNASSTEDECSRTPTPDAQQNGSYQNNNNNNHAHNNSNNNSSISITFDDELEIDVTQSSDVAKSEGPASTISSASSNVVDENQPSTSQQTTSTTGVAKKRRAPRYQPGEEATKRKSTRINKIAENEAALISNYIEGQAVGLKRNNIIPTGPIRQDFLSPQKSCKENEKLMIAMKGPVTRSNKESGGVPGVNTTPLKFTRKVRGFNPDGVATIPDYNPNVESEREDLEELISEPLEEICPEKIKDFENVWEVIQIQYEGAITIEAVLRRFNACERDVDKMLETIEVEFDRLPQPFRPFTVSQQIEFEKTINSKTSGRNFRTMQDRFLRQHHIGEIIFYYYNTKKRSCDPSKRGRCKCREPFKPDGFVERVECSNCTKEVRPKAAKSNKYCLICKTFYERNGKHRTTPGRLNSFELGVLNEWNNLEKDRKGEIELSRVREVMEEKRIEEIMTKVLTADEISMLSPGTKRSDREAVAKLLKPYQPTYLTNCRKMIRDKVEEEQKLRTKEYPSMEQFLFVLAFERYGKDFAKVAAEAEVSELEARIFYNRFTDQFNIDQLIYNNHSKFKKEAKTRETRSMDHEDSPADQPVPRASKKRAAAPPAEEDPSTKAPPAKRVTRRTRAS